ncbi:TetR/AcrR family transcriptional regulator [Marinobacter oulmenensis]|uniref:TetR/AcrR family transcriptional regulator n=1 Tax=Marinobacter oulmenensis TaxID=643747 RepID=A0A840U9E8_9GAMM|nr:TetR/AcrR family transcriptional regulator [Marinobacter oulmenensis]MBB5319770.1 TetR/AcrR family transcriptional regulator [Marinobacter oulmenensis]
MKSEALLREAVSAFNQKGFYATSLEDIANSMGVTKAALYHYFPSKHALLFEAFKEALRVAFESLEIAQQSGRTGLEKLQFSIQRYLEVALGELSRCVILTEEHALLDEDRAEIVKQRDQYEHALRDMVREGINDGSIIPCDPKLAIFSIFGAVNWVPKWFTEMGDWSNVQLSQAMAQLLCRSIASDVASELPTDVSALQVP